MTSQKPNNAMKDILSRVIPYMLLVNNQISRTSSALRSFEKAFLNKCQFYCNKQKNESVHNPNL